MTLKGTRKNMKLNGGDNKFLKDRLFKSFNDNKNYYLDIFIRKSNINELLKEARKLGSTDNTSILFWIL